MMTQHRWLNEENILRSTSEVEYHPLHPFLPPDAHVLFLGSFPPPRKRWCMDFYYPNWINDHWRIQGAVFYGNRDRFVDAERKTFLLDEIIKHCNTLGIAYFDTCTAVRRLAGNASDKFLEVVEPTDVKALMNRLPRLRAVVCTGEKAASTLCQRLEIAEVPRVNFAADIPGTGVQLYRLPSSSRAYPLAFDKKVEAYRTMFDNYSR